MSESTSTDHVLGALVNQISELTKSINDQRVTLATVAGDVKAVLARQDGADKDHDDHEARLRILEGHNTEKHGDRLDALERWRWGIPGVATVLAVIGLGVSIWAVLSG